MAAIPIDLYILVSSFFGPDGQETAMLKYHLYIDDSGSRYTNKKQPERRDGMDYFALGGILVAEKDIPAIFASHKVFSERWALEGPLHSS